MGGAQDEKARQEANDGVLCDSGEDVHGQEEKVLGDDRRLRKEPFGTERGVTIGRRGVGGCFLDARPCDVDIEKDQEGA